MQIGRYEVVEEIARGGMGAVFRARDPVLLRDVAIKVLLAGERASETQRARFARETDALARLRHPNIVPLFEAGELPQGPYVVMEFVDGESLDARLGREGPLPVLEALRLGETFARAIEHAHAHGILHRDLKPANVLMGRDGVLRVTDFGLARAVELEVGAALSKTGISLGTPGFWPPEQAFGERRLIGEASDVYGLGATLYALLTGAAPFDAPSLLELLKAMSSPAAPVSTLRPEVGPELDAIVSRALAFSPADRWPSVRAFADALTELRRHRGRGRGRAAPRSRRLPLVATAAAVIVVLAVGALAVVDAARRALTSTLDESPAAPIGSAAVSQPPGPPAVVETLPGAQGTADQALTAALQAARQAMTARRPGDARAALDAVIPPAGDPVADARCVEALFQRGLACAASNEPESALADWDRALAVEPDRLEMRVGRARVRGELRDLAGTIADTTYVIDRTSGREQGDVRAIRAWALSQHGDRMGALADWDVALALVPQDDWFLKAIITAVEVGALEAALRYADAGVAHSPASADAFKLRSAVHTRRAAHDLAEADLDRAVELDRTRAELWIRRAEVRKTRGDLRGAIADLTEALALDPTPAETWRRRAGAHQDLELNQEAVRDWDEALTREPAHVGARVNRALAREDSGDREGAMADADEAVRLGPLFAAAYAVRSRLHSNRKDEARSREDAERCVELDPKNADGWFNLARSRGRTDDDAGAIEAYGRVLELREDVPSLINRADLLRRNDRLEEAIADAERALKLEPQRPDTLKVLGLALMSSDVPGLLQRALATWTRFLELRPADGLGWRNLGAVQENLGDRTAARRAYAKALELLPPADDTAAFVRQRLATLDAERR